MTFILLGLGPPVTLVGLGRLLAKRDTNLTHKDSPDRLMKCGSLAMRTPQQAGPRPLPCPWGGGGILSDMDTLRPGENNTGFLRKWSSSGDWKSKVVLEVGDHRLNVQLTSRREPLLMLARAPGGGPLLIEPGEDAIVLNFALLGFDDFYVEGMPHCEHHESDVGYLMAADAGQMLGHGGMHINDAQRSFTIAGYRRHIVGHGAADGEVIALRFEVSE